MPPGPLSVLLIEKHIYLLLEKRWAAGIRAGSSQYGDRIVAQSFNSPGRKGTSGPLPFFFLPAGVQRIGSPPIHPGIEHGRLGGSSWRICRGEFCIYSSCLDFRYADSRPFDMAVLGEQGLQIGDIGLVQSLARQLQQQVGLILGDDSPPTS